METSERVSLECALQWQGPVARHRDRAFFPVVEPGPGGLPGPGAEAILQGEPGAVVRRRAAPGELLPARRDALIHRVSRDGPEPPRVELQAGRFYPRGLVPGLPGVQPRDRRPLHCLESDPDQAVVDLNHPLSGLPLEVELRLVARPAPKAGDACRDPLGALCERGAGLQTGSPLAAGLERLAPGFAREDEAPDGLFYARPRLVQHLDAAARAEVAAIHGRFLAPGAAVLDLMASWESHLPESPPGLAVTGLGMNEAELRENPRLGDYLVHDLNARPELPFPGNRFDLVLCTVSVEYLVHPLAVFREVARVLRPGGWFVVTFSDRWFPPKAIRLWLEMHPYERQALVLDYFRLAGGFTDLATESLVGLPRPADDKYAQARDEADPVFAVWGRSDPG